MIHFIGWLASITLAFSSLPLLWRALRTKRVTGLSLTFLIMCVFGFSGLLLNSLVNNPGPHVFNFAFNLIVFSILLKLYFKYERKK